MFIHAFAARATSSSRLRWSVASFELTSMDKSAGEWRLKAKAKGFHNKVTLTTGLFLHHRPHQMARPFARSIAITSIIPMRQRQKNQAKPKNLYFILRFDRDARTTLSRHNLDITDLFCNSATESENSCSPYQRNQYFHLCKLLRENTVEQSITSHTFRPTNQYDSKRPCQATFSRWWGKLSRR